MPRPPSPLTRDNPRDDPSSLLTSSAADSAAEQTVELKVGELQIDNQLPRAHFPVILGRSVRGQGPFVSSANATAAASRPILHAALSRNRARAGVFFVNYFSAGLQALALCIDEAWAGALWQLVRTLQLPARLHELATLQRLTAPPPPPALQTLLSRPQPPCRPAPNFSAATPVNTPAGLSLDAARRNDGSGVSAADEDAQPHSGPSDKPLSSFISPTSAEAATTSTPAWPPQQGGPTWTAIEAFLPQVVPPPAATSSGAGARNRIYARLIHLHPLEVDITYRRAPPNPALPAATRDWLPSAVARLGLRLLAVEEAPLRLNALLLRNAYADPRDLARRVRAHYLVQLAVGAYRVLGALDVLGNPVGFIASVCSGAADLFYEPWRGITRSPRGTAGPTAADVMAKLGKGSVSFVQKSVFAMFDTAAKLSGTVGGGVALLALDDAFLHARAGRAAARPRHIIDGIAQGVSALGEGLGVGLAGVLMKPVLGARADGAAGFFRGLGLGMLGVAMQPVAGVVDLCTKTLEGRRVVGVLTSSWLRGGGGEGGGQQRWRGRRLSPLVQ